MKVSEVAAQISLSIDIEVLLITDEDNAAVGYETSEIVLLGLCKLAEIDAVDFCANLGVVVKNRSGVLEQVAELGVATKATISVRHFFERLPIDVWESGQEIVMFVCGVLFH